MLFERLIAFGDPVLVRVVHRDFLLQHKHEVWLPRALEALGDGVSRGVNARVAQRRERLRIPFARQDRADDPLSGPAAQSLMTFASWMFIWVSAFCIRWMQVLTACT